MRGNIFRVWVGCILWGCWMGVHPGFAVEPTPKGAHLVQQFFPVRCEDRKDCASSTGMIISIDAKGSPQRCTGFLSETGKMVGTSSHCIPDEVKNGSVPCNQRVYILFPESDTHPAEARACQRLSHFTPVTEDTTGPDAAFFELDAPVENREVLLTNYDGFDDGMELRIARVNPTDIDQLPGGIVQTVKCKTVRSTSHIAEFDQPHAPIATFAGCMIRTGNSGSAVLDENGRVRGIAQVAIDLEGHYQSAKYLYWERPGDLAGASNMACVPHPLGPLGRKIPEGCVSSEELRKKKNLQHKKRAIQTMVNDIAQRLKTWGSSQGAPWQWRLGNPGTTRADQSFRVYTDASAGVPPVLVPVPYCMNADAHVREAYVIEMPVYDTRVLLTRTGQRGYSQSEIRRDRLEIRVAKDAVKGSFKLSGTLPDTTGSAVLFDVEIGDCVQ